MKEILNPNTSMAPVPVVMVSCGNEEKSNIITIAWTSADKETRRIDFAYCE